jgi:hypothetical protein
MSATNDMFDGLAAALVAAGVGVTVSGSAVFQPTDTAIVMETLPQTPDSAIAITIYPVSDDPTLSDSVAGIQIKARAAGPDPRAVNALTDAVFNAFQNMTMTLSTGICIQQIGRKSGVPLGMDDQMRRIRSENYYAKYWRPSTFRG